MSDHGNGAGTVIPHDFARTLRGELILQVAGLVADRELLADDDAGRLFGALGEPGGRDGVMNLLVGYARLDRPTRLAMVRRMAGATPPTLRIS